jgi:hypothetical protein
VADLGEWVRVDPDGARPLFDQLRTQIIEGVRDGRLPPGTRLPTVRDLAGQLKMAVNTVARGTFVARVDPADAAMATAAHAYASAARALGVGRTEALRYVEAAFD